MTKSTSDETPSSFLLSTLIQTVHRLRAPGGCPWDRAQTPQSLRQYLIEEAYEVIDCLDQIDTLEKLKEADLRKAFMEELGDVLMQVLLHSEIAREEGAFDIHDVARTLNEKLIRRHPHVFGELKADTPAAALQNWERQKAQEKASQPQSSLLDGLPKGLPTLQRAARVLEKVSRVGFQWKDMKGPLEKVDEELSELKEALAKLESEKNDKEKLLQCVESELGDLIFTLCNIAYLLKISPEDSLRTTLSRFEKRFRFVEQKLKAQGRTPEQSTLEEMDVFWNEAKLNEKGQS